MDLAAKIEALPAQPGIYLYKDTEGKVLYVGKAKSLRHRVKSYFVGGRAADEKTGRLLAEAVDVDYIVVDNEREALALENNFIKQYRPQFNVLLRDDKTYPYIKYTAYEKYPRVYVTRRLKKDGSIYFGPYFPGGLAHRIVELVHRRFLVPSCRVDLTRAHPRPCLQYYIKRCLGPCVPGLTRPERYAEAARDVRLFLEGRQSDLIRSLFERMECASAEERFEEAAAYRDLIRTVEEVQEKQKLAAARGDDTDILGYYREGAQLAVNLFHVRGGRVVDRRELFWEDLDPFEPTEFFAALLKQLYLDQSYIPHLIHVPVEFEERELLAEVLSERKGRKVEILAPQRGMKRALLDLVQKNARHSFEQRFRVLKPTSKAINEALQAALSLPAAPRRIESFDVSHIQGTNKVASMVVWESGRMKKSDYRKFIISQVAGNDDFASIREVIHRRYRRLQEEGKPLPDLILIDGGVGQLHAAAQALEKLEVINQPLASIAKKEEIIYVHGQEDEPIVLDRYSPVLHLVQQIRDETHRFAVRFHRQRRAREITTALLEIPGIGEKTARELLSRFGSLKEVRQASDGALGQVLNRNQLARLREHFGPQPASTRKK